MDASEIIDCKIPCFHFRLEDLTSCLNINGVDGLVVGAEDDRVVGDARKTLDHPRRFKRPTSRTVVYVQTVQTTVIAT